MKKRWTLIIVGVLAVSLAIVGLVSAQDPGETEEILTSDDEELICSGVIIHPVLEDLAQSYALVHEDVTYEDLYDELLGYFCEQGFDIGDIKHALMTSEIEGVDETYADLLAMVGEDMSWGEIWQELGLIGMGGIDPNDEDWVEDDDMDMSRVCSGEIEHPVLVRLAEEYDLGDEGYELLKDLFCEDHFGIGELKNALKRGTDIEGDWEEILGMRDGEEMEKTGWGLIWQRLGLIGKDRDKELKIKPEDHPGRGKGLDKRP